MNKETIRKRILKKLKKQKKGERHKKSIKIKEKLFSQLQFLQADTVMFYVAKKDEVETIDMIKEALKLGKKIVVPVTMVKSKKIIPAQVRDYKNELEKGPFGIYQPKKEYMKKVPLKNIDLVIVPGVAFDCFGNRLGRGGGFFDRFLAKIKKRKIPMFGLAFNFQLLKHLPVCVHDIPVNALITA